MNRWYNDKPAEMIIEFGKMKQIVSVWLSDTFGVVPSWIKPKGRYNVINFLVQTDELKISIDIFVSELVKIDDGHYAYTPRRFEKYMIPEDAPVIIDRVWCVITDLETKKRKQHDILIPMRYHVPMRYRDKNRLAYVIYLFGMQKYLSEDIVLSLRTQLENYAIWKVINK